MRLNLNYCGGRVFDLDQKTMNLMLQDIERLKEANEQLIKALNKILNSDYRGNMPREQRLARIALEEFYGKK